MLTSQAKVNTMRRFRRQHPGFTLVELVAMLLIMSILALVAIPRFFERSTFDARIFYDQMQSMLRFGQKVAIAQNRNVHVRLNGSSIAFCFTAFAVDGSCSAPVSAPGGANGGSSATLASCANSHTWFCEAIPGAITFASTPVAPRFYFNALGKPFLPADTPPTSSFVRLDLSLSGGGATRHIYIEPETGYVHP